MGKVHKGNFTCEPLRTKEAINKVLETAKKRSPRLWMMIVLQTNLGLRISDIVTLRFEDFIGDHVEIIETKTHKTQKIKVTEHIRNKIKEYSEITGQEKGFILKSRVKDRSISTRTAQMELKKLGEDLKLKNFSTHSLRKTFGYFAYQASEQNLILLMDRFNHSTPKMTLKYIGINQDDMDKLNDMVSIG